MGTHVQGLKFRLRQSTEKWLLQGPEGERDASPEEVALWTKLQVELAEVKAYHVRVEMLTKAMGEMLDTVRSLEAEVILLRDFSETTENQ